VAWAPGVRLSGSAQANPNRLRTSVFAAPQSSTGASTSIDAADAASASGAAGAAGASRAGGAADAASVASGSRASSKDSASES
jgi:hypothetical protein